jgi:hypothetical protein
MMTDFVRERGCLKVKGVQKEIRTVDEDCAGNRVVGTWIVLVESERIEVWEQSDFNFGFGEAPDFSQALFNKPTYLLQRWSGL